MTTTPIKHFMTKEGETGVKFSHVKFSEMTYSTYCTTSPIYHSLVSRIHKIRSNALPLQDGWESRLSWIVDVRDPTAYFCTQKVKLICGLILFITQEQFHLIITFGHRHSRNNFYWFKIVQTIYELLFVQSSQNNTKEIIAQQFHAPVD